MDDLAHRLGMDPIELRLRNEPDRDQSNGLPFSTRRLTECLHQGARRRSAGHGATPNPRSTRDGDRLIGIGMAAARVPHLAQRMRGARARINADGTADVQCGTSDMGPGTYTSMTQVAADALGLPLHRVRFALGDSRFPNAPSHSGSRTMASVGSAVFTTANMLRDRSCALRSSTRSRRCTGCGPKTSCRRRTDVTPATGPRRDLSGPAASPRLATASTRNRPGRPTTRTSTSRCTPTARCSPRSPSTRRSAWSGCGGSTVLRRGPDHQPEAGAQPGDRRHGRRHRHGAAGGHTVDHRDGRIVNANMSDYLVPVNADVPALDAAYLAGEDTVADPLGVKGLGEIVMVGVPAPSPTPCSTPPADASQICRPRWRNCSKS